MIANTLIVPVERPPLARDLKRALLTFDKVYVYSPDDRDLIPPHLFAVASSGGMFPIHMHQGPVRPLGKVDGYDDAFAILLQEAKAAINQESLKILEPLPDLRGQMFIGGHPPLPEWAPDPIGTYGIYRQMAGTPAFVDALGRGLDRLSVLAENDLDRIAPSGMDEQAPEFYIGGKKVQGPPPLTSYLGYAATDAERLALSRLCLGRLGAVVKTLATCHVLQLQPFTSDPGVARVIQMLAENAGSAMAAVEEPNEEVKLFVHLGHLHDLIMAEYIDPGVLDSMSIPEVLALRTRSWGAAGEAREALGSQLVRIAGDAVDAKAFQEACRDLIDDYLRSRRDWEHEARKLRIKFLCDIGVVTCGLGPGSELLQKLIGLGSFEALLVLGGVLFAAAKDQVPAILDLVKTQKEVVRLPGYSLVRTYGRMIQPTA